LAEAGSTSGSSQASDNTVTAGNPDTLSCPTLVTNQGGPVRATPNFRPIFWGQWDAATQSQVLSQFQTIASLPAFYNRLSEYDIHQGNPAPTVYLSTATKVGMLKGAARDNCSVYGSLNGDIANALDKILGKPTASSNDIFVVFLPYGTFDYDDCTSVEDCSQPSQPPWEGGPAGGYHYETDLGNVYAVVEGSYPSERIETLTHELSEVMTNPYPCSKPAWYVTATDDDQGKEICDLCAKKPTIADAGVTPIAHQIQGINVWRTWSNDACRCVTKRDVTLGDVTGGGLPTQIVERTDPTDMSGTWYANNYTPSWNYGGNLWVPFLLDTTGNGVTHYMVYDQKNALMYDGNIQLPGYSSTNIAGCGWPIPTPGDFDGDGIGDLAVFCELSPQYQYPYGGWTINNSSTGQTISVQWGDTGDVPVPGDYDGDGITDIAVFRPSLSVETWYIVPSSTSSVTWWWSWDLVIGDMPIPADFDGDGIVDVAYYRPSAGAFHVATSSSLWAQTYWYPIGSPNDWPVVKDWDGDWQSDFAVWHQADGTWHINQSHTNTLQVVQWGNRATDIPVDWFASEYTMYPHVDNVTPYSKPYNPALTPWAPSSQWSAGLAGSLIALGFFRLRRRRST